jgi:hypothetical protein
MSSDKYTLTELQRLEGLSVRTVNICERYGLTDLDSIISYYKVHQHFLNLQNAGRRTDQELTMLCRLYLDHELAKREEKEENNEPHFPKLATLTRLQSLAINNFVNHKFESLSPRAQNRILPILKNDISFEKIYRYFIENKSFIEITLPSSGVKTSQELKSYIEDIYSEYQEILNLDPDRLRLRTFSSWLYLHFRLKQSDFEPFSQSFLEKRFPLFKFINFLINNEKLFSKRDTVIFMSRSGFFKTRDVETLEDLGAIFNLSRERVRQIAEKINDKFDDRLASIETQAILLKEVIAYEWDITSDLIVTSNFYADKLNESEEIDFQPTFFTKVFSILIRPTHSFFNGNKGSTLSCCCIRNDLIDNFDFLTFWEDVFKQISEGIPKEYKLNFEGYLLGFMKLGYAELLSRVTKVCQEIVLRDFPEQISIDFEGNLVFHRNTVVRVAEYAAHILENAMRPMHIREIYQNMIEICPDYRGDYDNLRSHLNKDKDTFIYFGRKSTYGLRDWEIKFKEIKGGTIRSIIEEYLEQSDEPKHIFEILNYVLKYRPQTNERSVIGNLQLEQNGKFLHFNGAFWGLTDKHYPQKKTKFNSIPPSINRKIYIYLRKNGSTPFDQLIDYFSQSLQLKDVQVNYQLKKLVGEGKLSILNDGTVALLQNKKQ